MRVGIKKSRAKGEKNARIKEILFLSLLALILVFAVRKVFYDGDEPTQAATKMSDTEARICALLSEIDGVGEVRVVGGDDEDGVVVVCEGADDFVVVMNVREAVAAALGTEEKAVKVYRMRD